ncbi:uncharacterized protein LOC135400006 isoform X1 [Ornithodoros turicata]|uniref:uncharacterized protein LOC135400006 isoform X1 n=1 Tax=Ornithodoros turicata TaxID=34597 RepID=UPI00313A05CF
MLSGSSSMLDFFRRAAAFEKAVAFQCCTCCRISKYWWSRTTRSLIAVAAVTSNCVGLFFLMGEHRAGRSLPARIFFDASTIVCSILFFVYDSLHFVMARSSCEVLVEYTHSQVNVLKRMPAWHNSVIQVETLRTNICTIKKLKEELNNVWSWSMAASCASNVLVVCVTCHAAFTKSLPAEHFLIVGSYAIYSCIELASLAGISQKLTDEAQKLKDAVKSLPVLNATEAYVAQVQYLHDSIDPESMCLDAAGFFHINLSMLVSMSGSIITYTVILVQTSTDLEDDRTAA